MGHWLCAGALPCGFLTSFRSGRSSLLLETGRWLLGRRFDGLTQRCGGKGRYWRSAATVFIHGRSPGWRVLPAKPGEAHQRKKGRGVKRGTLRWYIALLAWHRNLHEYQEQRKSWDFPEESQPGYSPQLPKFLCWRKKLERGTVFPSFAEFARNTFSWLVVLHQVWSVCRAANTFWSRITFWGTSNTEICAFHF